MSNKRDERFLTVRDVVARLGLSEQTVRGLIAKRELAHVRLSPRGLRVPAGALREFISSRRAAAMTPRNDEAEHAEPMAAIGRPR